MYHEIYPNEMERNKMLCLLGTCTNDPITARSKTTLPPVLRLVGLRSPAMDCATTAGSRIARDAVFQKKKTETSAPSAARPGVYRRATWQLHALTLSVLYHQAYLWIHQGSRL